MGEATEIGQLLSDLEPFKYTVNGNPVKEIIYSNNMVMIRWYTSEETKSIKNWMQS